MDRIKEHLKGFDTPEIKDIPAYHLVDLSVEFDDISEEVLKLTESEKNEIITLWYYDIKKLKAAINYLKDGTSDNT